MFRHFIVPALIAILSLLPRGLHAYGLDTSSAPHLVPLLSHVEKGKGQWLRIRGLSQSLNSPESIEKTREALAELRKKGFRICAFVQWYSHGWKSGIRPGKGNRLPLDLRELYERTLGFANAYNDYVDAWEIYNEPDIPFLEDNAETYAAGLKTCYLAFKSLSKKSRNQPIVVMAPLALPPGPYMELFWQNGAASYTDAVNFHYYGYSQDFTDVVLQFEDAVTQTLPLPQTASYSSARPKSRKLPFFITEYGYGLLHQDARNTKEGRIRQWRWFADLVHQIHQLRMDATMAFLLVPYLEGPAFVEFGLLATEENGGALKYEPSDFGMGKEELWQRRIGEHFTETLSATPALAHLLDFFERNPVTSPPVMLRSKGAHRHRFRLSKAIPARTNIISAYPASPVVMDLVATKDFIPLKTASAHLVKKPVHEIKSEHTVDLVLYNWSESPVSGTLHIISPLSSKVEHASPSVTLEPGQRLVIPVSIKIPSSPFQAYPWQPCFVPDNPEKTPAFLAARFYPDRSLLEGHMISNFSHNQTDSRSNTETLISRPLANEEPALEKQGRWLVSKGMRVEESKTPANHTLWKFSYDALPEEPLRPAIAELPLPDDFQFDPQDILSFRHKVLLPPGKHAHPNHAFVGAFMDVYIRTANGNLYTTQPPTWSSENYRSYMQPLAAFTMGFYGRAKLPWRFFDNKPAALVFYFRSRVLPSSYEILNPQIIRWHD